MAKLTLSDLASLQNETSAIATVNDNNDTLETALENTLSRDGTSPNTMGATLDMNSNRIINLPAPSSSTEPMRVADIPSVGGTVNITNNITTNTHLSINVQDSPYSAEGNGTSDDTTAIQAAITAAIAAGGGQVYFPPGTYKTTSGLTVTGNNITLVGSGPASLIKPSGASNYDVLTFGTLLTLSLKTLSSNRVRGDTTIPITSTSGFTVGGYVYLQNNEAAAPNNAFSMIAQVLTITANTNITIDTPLTFPILTTDDYTIAVWSPVTGGGCQDMAFDGSSSTATTQKCLVANDTTNQVFKNLSFISFPSGSAFYAFRGLSNRFQKISTTNSGNASFSDFESTRQTYSSNSDIVSRGSVGFGPKIALSSYSDVNGLISSYSGHRGSKFQGCINCTISNIVSVFSDSTGVAVTSGTAYCNFNTINSYHHTGSHGSASTNRIGLWLSGENNLSNRFHNITCLSNTSADIQVNATDTSNIFNDITVTAPIDTTISDSGTSTLWFNVNEQAQITFDAGASGGPSHQIKRYSVSPAAADLIGDFSWIGNNSATTALTYAQIQARIDDATAASEDASILFKSMVAGALTTHAAFNTGKFVMGNNGTPITVDGSIQAFQVLGTNFATAGPMFGRWSANTSGGNFILYKSRGASVGTRATVASGDIIGSIFFYGDDGSGDFNAAIMRGVVDGAVSAGVVPMRLEFMTAASGDAPTIQVTLDSQGFMKLAGTFGRGAPVTKTNDFTLAATENWLICNKGSTTTVTLPAASSWTGREVHFKTIQAFTVVSGSSNVVPNTTATPGTAILPATDGAWCTLVSDGTNWIIMASSTLV